MRKETNNDEFYVRMLEIRNKELEGRLLKKVGNSKNKNSLRIQ